MVRAGCEREPNATRCYRRDATGWSVIDGATLWTRAVRLADALRQCGLRRDAKVGLLADPSPDWLLADLAIQLVGAASVPLFPNAADETLAHIAADAGLDWCFVAGDRGHAALPALGDGVRHRFGPAHSRCTWSLEALVQRGDPATCDAMLRALHRDRLATIIYTSGSTGRPKGVRLTHGNLCSQVTAACQRFPLDPARDVACSCLPWAHVFERMVLYTYLASGVPIYVCDDVTRLGERLLEIRPTVMTVVPRLLEKLQAKILAAAEAAPAPRRQLAAWALHQACAGEDHGLGHVLADALVYRAVRAKLGGRLHCVICGGAALAPAVERFFTAIGVPVYTGYGMTEASPVITVNCPAEHKPGTVGRPFPQVELRIGAQDEILARGPGVMQGYHQLPTETAATIDAEDWLHSGDCGAIDAEGYLVITGRIKELMKTAGGKYVCPVPIEQALVTDPLIDQALVVADGRPYVSALLFPDPIALAALKREFGCEHLSDTDFATRDEVTLRLTRLVESVNRHLDDWQRIRRWQLVTAPPSIENGELTPTMKLKRTTVCTHHREEISRLYRRATS